MKRYRLVGLLGCVAIAAAVFSTAAEASRPWLASFGGVVQVFADQYSERSVTSSRSPVAEWRELTSAGGVATQDAARVTNPATQIVGTASNTVDVHFVTGEYIAVRLKYDRGLTGITNPAGALFGRAGNSGKWVRLRNLGGSDSVTLAIDTTNDVDDGTYRYTGIINGVNIFDRLGCDQFRWGTETALAATGTTSTAVVQVKPL